MANRYTDAEIAQIKADNHVLDVYGREGFRIAHKAQANGQAEHHGPCPSCGGEDRFILYEADNRFWCRQCAISGDPIALVRLIHGLGFRGACERLAGRPPGASEPSPPAQARRQGAPPPAPKKEEKPKLTHAEIKAILEAKKRLNGDGHAYLARKNIDKPSGLFVDPETGELLIPLYGPGWKLVGIERIWPSGKKKTWQGTTNSGARFPVGTDTGDGPILIAEGLATAVTIHEATGLFVLAVFTCSNFPKVVPELRRAFPEREIIVCADKGNGESWAYKAARECGCRFVVPDFPGQGKAAGGEA